MISILMATRGRLESMERFVTSVLETADIPNNIEFIVYIDDDDSSYDECDWVQNVKIHRGPRKILSTCFEYERGSGPIFMLAGDDLVFHTQGWDTKVLETFNQYPDRIVLVYGEDGDPNKEKGNATHPFIHKNWIDAVGRYLPPYFSGDFPDTWLTALADAVGRKVKIDIYTEHIHPAFGKRKLDTTDDEKWEKHFRDNMPQKYLDTLPEREADAAKLKKFIEEFK